MPDSPSLVPHQQLSIQDHILVNQLLLHNFVHGVEGTAVGMLEASTAEVFDGISTAMQLWVMIQKYRQKTHHKIC